MPHDRNSMSVEELDAAMNAMIVAGELLRAFDTFCHEDIVMRENDAPSVTGFRSNRERESAFAASVASFNEVHLLSSAVSENVSFSEWLIDCTMKDGTNVRLEQVAVRRWRDGKVSAERFYYRPPLTPGLGNGS
jgi:hypothetical protein